MNKIGTFMRKAMIRSLLVTFVPYISYQTYYQQIAPNPLNFKTVRDKPKRVVVLGSGMVGLLTAYYISRNPLNHVTILEK